MKKARLPALPTRPRDGHKGTFGRVLIVGGSPAMPGAPILSGRAALRMGSGLVQIAVDDLMHTASIAACPELIGLQSAKRLSSLLAAAKQADAVAVGPGWGVSASNRKTLLALLKLETPLVVDADALNLLAKEKRWPTTQAKLVLTPHPGEMKRLAATFGLGELDASESRRLTVATKLAQLSGGVVLLKGAGTVVTDGTRRLINTTGDSSLSKAGTGDVLTGMIASLIGQGMTPFDAACLGAHLHGKAGEHAGKRLGERSVLASDVVEAIAEVLKKAP